MDKIRQFIAAAFAVVAAVIAAVVFGFIGLVVVGVMATVALATAIVIGVSARKTVKVRTETYRGEQVIEGEVVR